MLIMRPLPWVLRQLPLGKSHTSSGKTLASPVGRGYVCQLARVLLCVLFISLLSTSRLSALEYFISPSGSDTNSGTAAAPFATLGKARDAIRSYRSINGLPSNGVTVWLGGGYYNLSGTVGFDGRDCGAPGAPIVYAAKPGEQVYITGAT